MSGHCSNSSCARRSSPAHFRIGKGLGHAIFHTYLVPALLFHTTLAMATLAQESKQGRIMRNDDFFHVVNWLDSKDNFILLHGTSSEEGQIHCSKEGLIALGKFLHSMAQ